MTTVKPTMATNSANQMATKLRRQDMEDVEVTVALGMVWCIAF